MLAFGIIVLCLLGILYIVDIVFMMLVLVEGILKDEVLGFLVCFGILMALATAIIYVSLSLGEVR